MIKNTILYSVARAARPMVKRVPGALGSLGILTLLLSHGPVATTQSLNTQSPNALAQPVLVNPQITITVDPDQSPGDDRSVLKALSLQLIDVSGVKPTALSVGSPVEAKATDSVNTGAPATDATTSVARAEPDWYLWARLSASPSYIKVSSPQPASPVMAYAVHCEEGGAICLWNASGAATPFIAKLTLPRGVFRIERLQFTAPGGLVTRPNAARGAFVSSLRRLEGIDNAAKCTITKQGKLAAGEVSIIRYTDVAREARVAMNDVQDSLHNLAQSTPGPAARLRQITRTGERYSAGVTAGPGSTRSSRLACVHRLILVCSQAETLHRNFQSRTTVNSEPGAKTMGALERLADSLAETSAVLTGLVTQIELSPFTVVEPQNDSSHSGAGNAQGKVEATAVVSVCNTGAHTVDSVKLGFDARELPAGGMCIPDDPAYFGELRPGQSVRATFRLRLSASDELKAQSGRCVADVSYFTSGAPAHLRPRPW